MGSQVELGERLFMVEPVADPPDSTSGTLTDPDPDPDARTSTMKRTPQVVPEAGLPSRVTIYEVGPRDGLQNEEAIVSVEVKAEFIRRLVAAGLEAVEVTSLVHPRWVPQLADAEELLAAVDLGAAPRMPVLVPNERGLERALAAGVREIAIFGSATETFARRNLNRSLDEQYAMFEPVVSRARAQGLAVRGYLSMCFGDPWEGDVAVDQVVGAGRRLFDLGCSSCPSATRSVSPPLATWRPSSAASPPPGSR
ncbi:MAG: hypothetical protein WKF76_04275 [Nocardioidaceae bacterium]